MNFFFSFYFVLTVGMIWGKDKFDTSGLYKNEHSKIISKPYWLPQLQGMHSIPLPAVIRNTLNANILHLNPIVTPILQDVTAASDSYLTMKDPHSSIRKDWVGTESIFLGGRLDGDATAKINMTNVFDQDLTTGISSASSSADTSETKKQNYGMVANLNVPAKAIKFRASRAEYTASAIAGYINQVRIHCSLFTLYFQYNLPTTEYVHSIEQNIDTFEFIFYFFRYPLVRHRPTGWWLSAQDPRVILVLL